MCLQYAVMALGAVLSPVYRHLAEALYRRGRSYLEADEMKVRYHEPPWCLKLISYCEGGWPTFHHTGPLPGLGALGSFRGSEPVVLSSSYEHLEMCPSRPIPRLGPS